MRHVKMILDYLHAPEFEGGNQILCVTSAPRTGSQNRNYRIASIEEITFDGVPLRPEEYEITPDGRVKLRVPWREEFRGIRTPQLNAEITFTENDADAAERIARWGDSSGVVFEIPSLTP